MRRTLLRAAAAATAIATAVSMAACSSDDDSDGGSSADSAATSDGEFPTSVDTKFGEITIDEAPQRVVALGWGDAEIALDLGVQPVGASDWLGFGEDNDGISPFNDDSYDESPEILDTEEVEYEEIASLNPDLILDVRSAGDEDTYETLSDIATTVSVPEGSESFTTTWEDQVSMISTALGLPETGDELIGEVNGRIDEAKEANPDWSDKTASVVTQFGDGWGAYVAGDARMDLVTALGFQENSEVADMAEDNFYVDLSEENIDVTDSDVVIGFPIGSDTTEFEESSGWTRIGAVKDGRGSGADEELTRAFSLGTPDAMLYAIDELQPQLEEATS
ncbi:MAG: iron-siderophore ABC transporter substrate-binding protein [Corynebacterium sp.]|nr:iron-siderophore ABC transporter substrate-binding protein [Corynebacterium sp.]